MTKAVIKNGLNTVWGITEKAEAVGSGLPEALREAIFDRACTLLAWVHKESSRIVGYAYHQADKQALERGRPAARQTRAVAHTQNHALRLQMEALRASVRHTLQRDEWMPKDESYAYVRTMLQASLMVDEKLHELFPRLPVKTTRPAIDFHWRQRKNSMRHFVAGIEL